jgi:hypothetical protein
MLEIVIMKNDGEVGGKWNHTVYDMIRSITVYIMLYRYSRRKV